MCFASCLDPLCVCVCCLQSIAKYRLKGPCLHHSPQNAHLAIRCTWASSLLKIALKPRCCPCLWSRCAQLVHDVVELMLRNLFGDLTLWLANSGQLRYEILHQNHIASLVVPPFGLGKPFQVQPWKSRMSVKPVCKISVHQNECAKSVCKWIRSRTSVQTRAALPSQLLPFFPLQAQVRANGLLHSRCQPCTWKPAWPRAHNDQQYSSSSVQDESISR